MKQTLAFWAAAVISFLVLKPTIADPGVTGVGDQLSLSITNKYGDVLANPTVAQILTDGLVLERGTLAMKVNYGDLPPDIRQEYQPLAAGVITNEEKEGAVNAAYFAYTRQLQAEQARHLAAQETQENELAKERTESQPTNAVHYVAISIPPQNWKLTIANLGYGDWQKQQNNGQIVLRSAPRVDGFNFLLIVDTPANNLPGNDAVYNFYWLNMAHDSLIDAQSVKVEKRDTFVKVSYSAQGQPNVNYFFAYQGQWVDVHLSKGSFAPGDEKLFAAFDAGLSYGQ
jgi:hypothetical protein